MLGNLHVRLGVGVEVKVLGLHHLIHASLEGGTPLEVCFILLGKLRQIQNSPKNISLETLRLVGNLERYLNHELHK